jgi:hypothetical protein
MIFNRLKILLTLLVGLNLQIANGQQNVVNPVFAGFDEPFNLSRPLKLGIGFSALGTGSLIGLNQLWYSQYERRELHSFDDSKEWLQMDKAGHFLSAYQINRGLHQSFMWAGADEKSSLLWSSAISWSFLAGIELMDGYSEGWGFSWTDFGANTLGIGMYLGQDALWSEQRILPKFSYTPSPYASCRPNVLGTNHVERVFKDYNGQTYWLSFDIMAFKEDTRIPSWLAISVGYGAEGMLGAVNNELAELECLDLAAHSRTRQIFLSIDLNSQRIKSNKKWVQGLLKLSEYIKIPAPAIAFDSKEGLQFYPIYF